MLPIKLKLENFFSHKKSTIDFTEFDSALLLGNTEGDYAKSNGSGKSAIFESILWCLFNKSRASTMDDIVLWGEAHCSVTFDFIKSGQTYRVKRTRNKINSTSLVEFYHLNEKDEWQSISASTSGDTSKKIESIIKLDYKTFINSIYFRQNDISEFAESEPSKRKEILKSIIDISKWDDYEKEAKKEIRDINNECKILESKSEGLAEDEGLLAELNEDLDSLCDLLDEKNNRVKFLSSAVEKTGVEYSAMKKSLDTDSYDKIVENIESSKGQGKALNSKLFLITENLSSINSERLNVKNNITKLNKEINSFNVNEKEKDQDALDAINKNILKHKTDISLSKEMLKTLVSLKHYEGSCNSCWQDISEELHVEIQNRSKEKINSYKSSIKIISKELKALEAEKILCKDNISNLVKLSSLKGSMSPLERELTILDNRVNSLDNEKKDLIYQLKSIKNEIKMNEDSLSMLKNDNFKALRERSKNLKIEYLRLTAEVSEKNQDFGALKEKISTIQASLEKKIESREKLLENKKRVHIFEKLCRFFGKNGIQTILLDAVIEDLEKSANNILASICNEPSAIMLDTQRIGADGVSVIETLDLRIRRDGVIQNFKSLSGGEQFRMSLALRIALSEISSRHGGSNLEMLMLDEINSPLDKHGTDTLFISVIKALEKKYKILIITHDDSLKEKFINILNITKVNGESRIEFVSR